MKNEKDEELDKFFRKGLEDPVNDAAFRDADWDAMEQMLDSRKKRPAIIFWLPIIGGIAAMLLIFLGWWFFKPVVTKNNDQQQAAVTAKSGKATGANRGSAQQEKKDLATSDATKKQDNLAANTPSSNAVNKRYNGSGSEKKDLATADANKKRNDIAANTPPNTKKRKNNTVSDKKDTGTADANQQKSNLIANNSLPNTTSNQPVIAGNVVQPNKNPDVVDNNRNPITDNQAVTKDNAAANTIAATTPVKVKSAQSKVGYKPQLAIGVFASSDLNGVNSSFQQGKIGGNFGVMFAVGVSKKWTISTGAMYSIKPYLTNMDNYHTAYKFPTEPSSVNANCRMIDIPLDVNYQVYSKHGNKFTIGTGLSSYIMLREDYTFNYNNTNAYNYNNPQGPAGYSVINKNRNYLSILNLNASYDHQINSKMGITFQPYLKIPLANVGASQVRLQTTGIAVGLSWNLNSLKKP